METRFIVRVEWSFIRYVIICRGKYLDFCHLIRSGFMEIARFRHEYRSSSFSSILSLFLATIATAFNLIVIFVLVPSMRNNRKHEIGVSGFFFLLKYEFQPSVLYFFDIISKLIFSECCDKLFEKSMYFLRSNFNSFWTIEPINSIFLAFFDAWQIVRHEQM